MLINTFANEYVSGCIWPYAYAHAWLQIVSIDI